MAKQDSIPADEWVWYGFAGHFIAGSRCRYHLCTRIGGYLVSTLGAYYPEGATKAEPIGAGVKSLYETMVFHCDGETEGGDPNVISYSEIDSQRYATSLAAEHGHREFCRRYAAKATE